MWAAFAAVLVAVAATAIITHRIDVAAYYGQHTVSPIAVADLLGGTAEESSPNIEIDAGDAPTAPLLSAMDAGRCLPWKVQITYPDGAGPAGRHAWPDRAARPR